MKYSMICFLLASGLLCAQPNPKKSQLKIDAQRIKKIGWPIIEDSSPIMIKGMTSAEEKEAEEYSAMRVRELQASANFLVAAFKSDINKMKEALNAGADINTRSNDHGSTALMLAAHPAGEKVFTFLLAQPGIDVKVKDDLGRTALNHVVYTNNVRAIRPLLDAGANINDKDDQGRTPVYTAVMAKNTAALHELLRYAPDLSIRSNDNATPLMMAAFINYPEGIALLLDAHADPFEKKKENTFIEIAQHYHPSLLQDPIVNASFDRFNKRERCRRLPTPPTMSPLDLYDLRAPGSAEMRTVTPLDLEELKEKMAKFRASPEHMSRLTPEELQRFEGKAQSGKK